MAGMYKRRRWEVLSDARLAVLRFCASYVLLHQYFPALDAVAAGVYLSVQQAQRHMKILEGGGYVEKVGRRGWRITEAGWAAARLPAPIERHELTDRELELMALIGRGTGGLADLAECMGWTVAKTDRAIKRLIEDGFLRVRADHYWELTRR